MKKKLNLTYVGNINVKKYGLYIGDDDIQDVICKAMCEDGDGGKFIGSVTLTIEPTEDAGLHVEVE